MHKQSRGAGAKTRQGVGCLHSPMHWGAGGQRPHCQEGIFW